MTSLTKSPGALHTAQKEVEPLYMLQPPMHFNNRSTPQKMQRYGGHKIDDGATKKLASYLGSASAASFVDQRHWEAQGMPTSPSPLRVSRSQIHGKPSNSKPLLTKDLLESPASPLAERLLSVTNGLAKRIEKATCETSSVGVDRSPPINGERSAGSLFHPSPEKKNVLNKLAFLIERFNKVATISTLLEQRVYDLTDYCRELEEKLAQTAAERQDLTSLRSENAALRRSLNEMQTHFDRKCQDLESVSHGAGSLVARIDQGETLLGNMHKMIQQIALKLKQEHEQRCAAEAMVLSLEKIIRSGRRSRRGSVRRLDVAHHSADEADDADDEVVAGLKQHSRNGSSTPLAQYQGAFSSMEHFDDYLQKLRSKRLAREKQRELEREKRKGTAGASEDFQKPLANIRVAQPKQSGSHSKMNAVKERPQVPVLKSHVVSIAERPVSGGARSSSDLRSHVKLAIDQATPSRDKAGSPDPELPSEAVRPFVLTSGTNSWSGLDSIEELRDIHDAGQSVLQELSHHPPDAESDVGAQRRRAVRDTVRLENHVEQLTRQYHDLLAAAVSQNGTTGLLETK